jgi:hypothetical protein
MVRVFDVIFPGKMLDAEKPQKGAEPMTIDFELTDAQKKLQRTAREFARDCLDPVVRQADRRE